MVSDCFVPLMRYLCHVSLGAALSHHFSDGSCPSPHHTGGPMKSTSFSRGGTNERKEIHLSSVVFCILLTGIMVLWWAPHHVRAESWTFTSIDVPGAYSTVAFGINNSGQIVGSYSEQSGTFHGYFDTRGSFTEIDVPGASSTATFDINSAGQIVGYYHDAHGDHGFLETRSSFVTITVPGATNTEAFGINDRGQI